MGVWIGVGPRKEPCSGVRWGPRSPTGRDSFGGHTWACSDLPAVDMLNILKVAHKRVATQLWPLDTSMPICM